MRNIIRWFCCGVWFVSLALFSVPARAVCPPITLTSSLPNGTFGIAYSQTITSSGGVGPYTYAVTAGVLPGGLGLSPGGTVSGTPSAVGSNTFTVTSSDANGCTGSQAISLTIQSGVIYYSRQAGIDGTIWSIQGDGSNDHQITVGEQPRISPNGRYLAFHKGSPNSTPAQGDIYVRDLQTGIETLVFTHTIYNFAWEFDWTGNSTSIVFDHDNCIKRVDRTGLNLTNISCFNTDDDAPAVNKVDGRIAFHNPGLGGLFIMDANGTNRSHIVNTTSSDVDPYWSPDGQWLTFWTDIHVNGNYNLCKIRPDGSGRTVLSTVPVSSMSRPAWSADGSRLVFNGTVNAITGIYSIASNGSGSPVLFPITAGAAPYSATDIFGNVTYGVPPANPPVLSAPSPTNNVRPTWTWTSGGGGSGVFRYQFNSESAGGWTITTNKVFTSPGALAAGSYTLYVQEVDSYGRWSLSGSKAVVIDLTVPDTVIGTVSPADNLLNADLFSTISIPFSSPGDTGATFECQYDFGTFASCASPLVLSLVTGGHTFAVRAIDVAGNVDPTPATYQWSVIGKMFGNAYSWGQNTMGTLGIGSRDGLAHPVITKVNGPIEYIQTAGNVYVTFAVRADGTLWGWGTNVYGMLGIGSDDQTLQYDSPNQITTIIDVKQVAVANGAVFALKNDGTVWSWGINSAYGGLGDSSIAAGTVVSSPHQIPGLSGITKIDTHHYNSIALKSDGSVWTWGLNNSGQLGIGTQDSGSHAAPSRILLDGAGGSFHSVVAIAAGNGNSYAVKDDYTVWSWGDVHGNGLGSASGNQTRPTMVTTLANITAIAGGAGHVIALDSSGEVWAWGDNSSGQTGSSDTTTTTYTPTQVPGLTNIAGIAAGGYNSLARTTGNTVWSWGRNDQGQLGIGVNDYVPHPTPARVAYLSGVEQVSVSKGSDSGTCLALKSSWVTMPVLAQNTYSILHPSEGYTSLALDSQDKVHIAYVTIKDATFSGNKTLKYLSNANGVWVDRGTVPHANVDQAAIAVDSQGSAHFSFHDSQLNRIWYAKYNGSGFDLTDIDSGGSSGITLDSSNNVHICYSGSQLNYAFKDTNGQLPKSVVNPGVSGVANCSIAYSPPIAGVSLGIIAIAYMSGGNVYLSQKTLPNGAWTHEQIFGGLVNNLGAALSFDGNGNPHVIVATNSDQNFFPHALLYKYKNAGVYKFLTIENIDITTGLNYSLGVSKIAGSHTTYVSYFDAVNMDLKVATVDYSGSGKVFISTVDSDGYVGEYPSLAVDSKGIAHVSYFSYQPLEGLKYATNADITGPSGSIVITNSNGYSKTTDVSLALTCNDGFGIGCWRMQFSDDGTNWTAHNPETFAATKAWSLTPGDGPKTVYARFEDGANNWTATYPHASIFLDTQNPVGAPLGISSFNGYVSNRLVLLNTSCSDPGTLNVTASGCDRVKFSTDGTNYYPPEPYGEESSIFLPTVDGLKDVYAIYIDKAGNESVPYHASVRLDTAPPTTTAFPEGSPEGTITSTFDSAQSVRLTCDDGTNGSGCAGIWYSLDGGQPSILYNKPITIDRNLTLRYYSVDSLGHHEVTRSADYNFSAGYTKLSLELTTPVIDFGGEVTAVGRLHNMTITTANPQGNKADPTGETITITIQPVATPLDPKPAAWTVDTVMNKFGEFNQVLTGPKFENKRSYNIHVSFAGSSLLSPSDSVALPLLVGASAGYAILVEGKLPDPAPEGLASHNKTANRIYDKLKTRGFAKENIYYFNYDKTRTDVIRPSKSGIQSALQIWARDRMNGLPAPLYVIMVDHGSIGEFKINNEVITPTNLGDWLTTLEAGLNAEALLEKRVVIIGSCFSGSFIEKLSKGPKNNATSGLPEDAGRVIITSAAHDEVSYKGPVEGDGIRSGEYFLEELFTQLERGQSIRDSFIEASSQTRTYTQKGGLDNTNSNAPYFDGAVQHPMLDDNGDHAGSNSLSSDPNQDGASVASMVLGVGVGHSTNSALNPAEIDQVTPSIHLSATQTSADLWATVNDTTQVDTTVWVEIRNMTQNISTVPPAGTEQVDLNTTKIPMKLNTAGTRYELTLPGDPLLNLPGFTEAGRYEIFYFVRDMGTYKLAPMKRSVVYHNFTDNPLLNPPPPAPEMTNAEPPNHNPDISHRSTSLYFGWGAVSDSTPAHPPITYSLIISEHIIGEVPNPTYANAVYFRDNIPTNSTVVGPEGKLAFDKTYHWVIRAVDRYGAFSESAVMTFDTLFDQNADIVVLQGSVKDAASSVPIRAGITVTNTLGFNRVAVADVAGAYYFSNLGATGTFTVTTSAAGYADDVKTITIISAGHLTTFTHDVQLSPPGATHALSVTVDGSGRGTVTSSPQAGGGISCVKDTSGTCSDSANFPVTQPVTLSATRSSGSVFSGWTCIGCTTDGLTCSLASMSSDKSVSAKFDTTPPFFLYSTTPTADSYRSVLQDAYDAAADNAVIQMQATVPSDSGGLTVTPASGKTVTVQGGYDADFTPNPSGTFTTIQGKVTLQNGTLRVQRVKVK